MKSLLRDNEGFYLKSFTFDFSQISNIYLKQIGVKTDEVISIFENINSQIERHEEYNYIIGFSLKRKFVHVIFEYSEMIVT